MRPQARRRQRSVSATAHGVCRAVGCEERCGVEGSPKELESRGIIGESLAHGGLTEETPEAYKDIESVVDVVHNAELAARVVRLKPTEVIKR